MSDPSLDQSPSSVTEYLEHDHRRLDALFEASLDLAETTGCAEAQGSFREFALGLSRHIDVEEQVLFPAFERLAGSTNGPTAVMRAEHGEIRRCLDTIVRSVEAQDRPRLKSACDALLRVLSAHNMKEEAILYPMTDRWISGVQERRELVQRLRSF